jgi:VWFA-related protein
MTGFVFKPGHSRLSTPWGVALLFVITFAPPLLAAQAPAAAPSPAQASEPEFKLRVQTNVVIVRVVVRDSKGRAVRGLRKEDFKVSDNHKPQVISGFSVETSAAAASPPQPSAAAPAPQPGPESISPQVAPLSYLAFYFDDLNSAFDSLVRSRQAAEQFIAGLPSTERIAVFTSSGTQSLDFTDDRHKLHEALAKLHPNPRLNFWASCPKISDYLANQIVNLEDPEAYRILRDEAINDCHMDPRSVTNAILRMQAQAAFDAYVMQARVNLANLEGVIERLAMMPGERQVMMVSDGFMDLDMRNRVESVVDHALRARVMISALDGAGLVMRLREGDASLAFEPVGVQSALSYFYEGSRESAAAGTLAEIADGTGGQFFHNNNDLLGGLRRILMPPETSYVLTFSPEKLRYDGAFHSVKVSLANGHGLTVQSRKGYFAPRQEASPEELAKDQIREAIFAQEPIQGLPLAVHAEAHKTGAQDEEIAVQAQLDVRSLPFEKHGDRHVDNLTITVALFDHDGKFVSGIQQTRALALKRATLAELEKSGLAFNAHVSVRAGAYTVRVVVRDSQGGEMAAVSKAVEVPL